MRKKFRLSPKKNRRLMSTGFGLAPVRREGGWNYDITRGGVERRRNEPNYNGYWKDMVKFENIKEQS